MPKRPSRDGADLVELEGEVCDIGGLAESLGFLTRVTQLQRREFIRGSARPQPSLGAYSALAVISRNPGIRQRLLATILQVQDSNMTNLIRQLLDQGLVDRRPIAPGRRAAGLWLTAAGQSTVAAQAPGVEEIDRAFAGALSDTEYAAVVRILRRLFVSRLRG